MLYLHLFTGRTSNGGRTCTGPMTLHPGTGSSLLCHPQVILLQALQNGKVMMQTLKPHSTLRTWLLVMLKTMLVTYILQEMEHMKWLKAMTSLSLKATHGTKLNQKKKLLGRQIQ